MRILVITPFFYPHQGGSQRYIDELYVTLQKLHPNLAVDILCYNTNHAPSTEMYRGMQIYRVACVEILPGQFAIPNPLHLIKVIRFLHQQHQYDFVNSHTRFFDNSWWTPLVAKYLQARSVLTDHCAAQPVHPNPIVNLVNMFVDRILVPVIGTKYDLVTVVSQATQKYLASIGLAKSLVIYPGINLDLFDKVKKAAAAKKNGQITVSFIGRLIPSKGPQLFLAAVQPLLTKYPKLEVVVAGKGPLFNKLSIQYQHPRLKFAGQLSASAVAELLNVTDIIVLPSTHHEGFPITILEAGAANCAVITTNQGGTSEIIENHQTGLIIKPTVNEINSSIQSLLDQPKQRTQLAQQLHHLIQTKFTWEKSAREFWQLLSRVPLKSK